MSFLRTLRLRLVLLVESERGMALPTAMLATVASLGLAGAAVMSTVEVQRGTKRDGGSKSAIAAADAGASLARLRLNRYANELSKEEPCLNVNLAGMLETGPPAEGGWCAPIEGSVGNAAYRYWVSPVASGLGCGELCVVATGSADGVTRRIQVAFDEQGPGSEITEEEEKEEESSEEEESEEESSEEEEEEGTSGGLDGLVGIDDIELVNNSDARVSIGTNGEVEVHNNANVCGNIRYGIGKNKPNMHNNGTQCSGYKQFEGNVEVPPVSSFIPADIATNNSNYRLVKCTKTKPTPVPTGCQSDTYSGSWEDTVPWNPVTRTISTSNNATLTLGGGDYFVCKFELNNNAHLIMADGAQIRIFFDTPENCKLPAGTKQISIQNNANITATGYQPTIGRYDMPGFYLLGSTTISTKVEWKNNSGTNELVLYGPNSNIVLENNAVFYGVIVGKTVLLSNNVIVIQDSGYVPPPEIDPPSEEEEEESGEEESGEEETVEEKEEKEVTTGTRYFTPQSYVECSGEATPTPDANC